MSAKEQLRLAIESMTEQEAVAALRALAEASDDLVAGCSTTLRSTASEMAVATVHVSADVQLTGSYEPVGDVLYLSTADDDEQAPAQETPEGHAVRIDGSGRITHVTAINAKWLLDRDGELVATLHDGRRLRLGAVKADFGP